MRILYCNKYNFPFSGTEVYLFDLMGMMEARGHELALFSMADERGAETPYDDYFVPHIDFKNGRHSFLESMRLAAHAIYSRGARYRVGQMIEKFRPDVAHVRNIYHHLSPSILWELKQRGVPVLYHLNDFKLLCPTYNLVARGKICERCQRGRFWNVVTENCYSRGRAAGAVLAVEACIHGWLGTYEKCVTRFLAPSEFVRAKLISNGWPGDRIDVLPHFQKLPAQAMGPPSPNAPILYFGRLSPEKGVSDLLRALRYLPTLHLKIAGDGPSRVDLEELTRRLELKNVEFLGHLPGVELDQVIREARFTVLPSRAYETLGKTILESYAQSRTVVASDLGSRREFVQYGRTGLLYQAGNVEELAAALSWLDQRPDLAAAMGRAGYQFVREHHSPEQHYESMIALYERLAEGPGRFKKDASRLVLVPGTSKPRLRVAFIGGRGVIGKYSGIEGYYEEVGSRLAASGHEVTVYCRTFFTPRQSEHNGMRLVRLPTVRSKHFETVLHTTLSTLHVLFQPCDIVHYHTLGPALFSFVPRLIGKKTAVTVQGLDWQRKKWGRVASAVLRLGERAAVWCPDTTMVVSRTLWSYFREHYGLEARYIANGALLREHRNATKILEWGLLPERYVLFLGRFSPEKNCHLLIEAYEPIETEVKLVLAGGGNRSDAYCQELLQHASDRVRLLPYVSGDAFEELLTNAMLFVLPSDLEGLSLALLEAMGAGLCVLASDIPENRELVDGVGFLFRPGDRIDLQRMLRLLLADPELRKASGRAAKQRIREQYLWPKIAHQVEEAYMEMMGWRAPVPISSPVPAGVPVRAAQDGGRQGPNVIPIPVSGNNRRAA